MIPVLPTTGEGMPLGWIVAGNSGVACQRCHAALWLQPGSYVLWPLEIRAFVDAHAACTGREALEDFNQRVERVRHGLDEGDA